MNNAESTSLATRSETATSFLLSLFFVVFVWGFWMKGPYALGANFSIFLGALTLFFVSKLRRGGGYSTDDLKWTIPLLLMALSFAIYENPFIKMFNLLVFPASLALFFAYSWVEGKRQADWNLHFLAQIARRLLTFFGFLWKSLRFAAGWVFNENKSRRGTLKRVGAGSIILFIALLVIVPILSSADPQFALKLGPIRDFVANILSASIIGKIIVFVVLGTFILAALLAWGRPHAMTDIEGNNEKKELDLLVTSIVLGGIFVVYLLFLSVQLDRLWVGALPIEFSETEGLVKSGFWQLLFLTFVNIAIFIALYRKTAPLGQKLLGAFSIASILLLVSSAQRMYLYVTNYGFSYEKFYASYAVLFCAILFLWLISRLFAAKRANAVRFLAFQFLWMFALVSIFPTEQFILKSNMALVKKEGSHISLREMSMLSSDVLNEIKEYQAQGALAEAEAYDWNEWIAKRESELRDRKWYEQNLSAAMAR